MTATAMTRTGPDGRGVVRIEDVYDTDIQDRWEACTDPGRLARWIATVSGEARVGNTVHAVFTSSWSGAVRIDECEAPHHLLVTNEPGSPEETQTEAWLVAEGGRTRLIVEDRGLAADNLSPYRAGWQAHLADLGEHLRTGSAVHPSGWSPTAPAGAWHRRWVEMS
ncbi:MAG: SRPBCC domain-containing protein [Micrococcales bacterium]|nr:SRPBCC domain-containing protein [Micrococcales bacterium]